jgi:hypothetical protein
MKFKTYNYTIEFLKKFLNLKIPLLLQRAGGSNQLELLYLGMTIVALDRCY